MGEYYDVNTIVTKQRLLNFVIGARGFGKTYGFKKYVTSRFLKTMDSEHPEQFIYIRKTKEQTMRIAEFWGETANEFPDHKLITKGDKLYVDGKLAGWIIPLSAYITYKSVDFPNVKYIIFDEFLDDSGWPKKEKPVVALLTLMDSVMRNREGVQVFCLSNAVQYINEYFTYFNIVPRRDSEYTMTDEVAVQIVKKDSEQFVNTRKHSHFGKLISGTPYGAFALDNEFKDDNDRLIRKRPPEAKPIATIKYDNITYGVWWTAADMAVYIDDHYNKTVNTNISVSVEDIDENNIYKKGITDDMAVRRLMYARDNSFLFYTSIGVRERAFEFLTKLGIY